MRVAIVGSGGREHALAHAISRTAAVMVTPGNAGNPWSVDSAVEDLDADLVVIGPEQPLVDGLADRLRARGAAVLGPGADGARLEGSKAWMKDVLVGAGVPTARHGRFTAEQLSEAEAFLRSLAPPWVVKTDGLAAGKGVCVTMDLAEAVDDVRDKLSGSAFGDAGRTVVIEEGLSGPEVSLLCLCDGRLAVPLPLARDHKRVGDGDTGPNTGGMGAVSPVPGLAVAIDHTRLVQPVLDELRRRGIDYRGVLYAGLMLTADGPKVLEFNVRFGDPEAQVILPRLAGDVTALLAAAASGALDATSVEVAPHAAVAVVGAAPGYPEAPRVGGVIGGVAEAEAVPGATAYWAGVRRVGSDLVTAGGRVVAVTGLGADVATARSVAYDAIGALRWDGMVVRSDIAVA